MISAFNMDASTHENSNLGFVQWSKPRVCRPSTHGGPFELFVPSELEYRTSEGPQRYVMSRQRTNDLLDTVLRNMSTAPKGTFTCPDDFVILPLASKWLGDQVSAYISGHTVYTLDEPVLTREMKDYDFPEDLKDAPLEIDTGVGHYYSVLRDKDYQGEDQSSKVLNGEHDCWDESSRFEMPVNPLVTRFDSKTGKMKIQARNRVWICKTESGQFGTQHLNSFREYMSELMNSDDLEVVHEIKKMQKLHRGAPSPNFMGICSEHGNDWLWENGMTCSDLTKKHRDFVNVDLESKHLDEEVTEDNLLAGVDVALQGVCMKSKVSQACKADISAAVQECLSTLVSQRPRNTTLAQWSQALAETAYFSSGQMVAEAVRDGDQSGGRTTDDREGWHFEAIAEVVNEPPNERHQLIAPTAYHSRDGSFITAGYVKLLGQVHKPNDSAGLYTEASEVDFLWIPIEGIPVKDVEDQSLSDVTLGGSST